jgi:hypothetical protein
MNGGSRDGRGEPNAGMVPEEEEQEETKRLLIQIANDYGESD